MTKHDIQFKLHDGGDVLTITYDGNMHVAPCCGAQYATEGEAMRRELAEYLGSCGYDWSSQYEDWHEWVDSLVLSEHGEWVDVD